jgi:hypothetical protein
MKRLLLPLVLFLSSLAAAQHSATINWNASATSGIDGYKIYRASCTEITGTSCTGTEGTFAEVGSVNSSTTSYQDTTASANTKYVYYVTAFCPVAGECSAGVEGESAASNHWAVTIPADPATPPAAPAITGITVALTTHGVNQDILARWQFTPNKETAYFLKDANGTVLKYGTVINKTGVYSVSLRTRGRSAPFSLTVCESVNATCETAVTN